MNHWRTLMLVMILGSLAACSTTPEQRMINVIGRDGPFAMQRKAENAVHTGIGEAPYDHHAVPATRVSVAMSGPTTSGSIVILVFKNPQEAQRSYEDLSRIHDHPAIAIGDQGRMGVASETSESQAIQYKAYTLLIQRCQGIAVVTLSKRLPEPSDLDHLRTYGHALDARLKAALCP